MSEPEKIIDCNKIFLSNLIKNVESNNRREVIVMIIVVMMIVTMMMMMMMMIMWTSYSPYPFHCVLECRSMMASASISTSHPTSGDPSSSMPSR